MKYKIAYFLCCFFIFSLAYAQKNKQVASSKPYFPPTHTWEEKLPTDLGLNAEKVKEAVAFAIANESKNPRNMEINHYQTFGKEPFGFGIGAFAERGAPTGLIIYKGYIVAKWGDLWRNDMTHSVTKSLLSTTIGLAVDKGLIRSVNDTVAHYIPPIEPYGEPLLHPADQIGQSQFIHLFNTPHNQGITWEHLLRQTSDWEGTLWGKPDWADRPSSNPEEWYNRKRNPAGTVYEYNDVRVNVLALATTSVWRKPLPQVLKTYIMDEIGASSAWRWTGYRNAWIVLDGQAVQSVSGGGHWGGGVFINAYDMARFGLLTMHKGNWNGKQLISENWIKQATTPTTAQTGYGYMNYFLNADEKNKHLPSAPATAFSHIGNGTNAIYVDSANELVVVARWIEGNALDGLIKRVLEAKSK
ncbi:MAG: beta-lactamase family protein [Thermoflexibacter sp.]|nr:beta-lactamase family protein [Thermoflexibacter sp.]